MGQQKGDIKIYVHLFLLGGCFLFSFMRYLDPKKVVDVVSGSMLHRIFWN
jgi:hypothetical protein